MLNEIVLDPSQERAIELVLSARMGIITGGPGTGKTTCLRTALDRLDAAGGRPCGACRGQGVHLIPDKWGGDPYPESCEACVGLGRVSGYALAAPTGKAARRMSEATGRSSRTVHRLLEYGPLEGSDEMGFRRNVNNPLDVDLVVIDEASMLDVDLAASLVRAIDPRRTRLVLVGDAHQLPSVGPGRVFADLIASDEVEVARLTQLHRAAAESWVCTQAPKILAGEVPSTEDRRDFLWFRVDDRDKASATLVRVVTEVLPKMGVAPGDIQVLIPQRVGPAGCEAVNGRLQTILNAASGGVEWKLGPYVVRAGDRVIQTSNDYQLGVMNGEVGVVDVVREAAIECPQCEGSGHASGQEGRAAELVLPCPECDGKKRLSPGMLVRYPDGDRERRVMYSKLSADRLALAYALTIHKSQGSEWPWVVVLVHSTHTRMLTRQLLYTAITRARTGVVIVGDAKGLERAVAETRDARRNTALVERLRAA